jgi:hypothetical protein
MSALIFFVNNKDRETTSTDAISLGKESIQYDNDEESDVNNDSSSSSSSSTLLSSSNDDNVHVIDNIEAVSVNNVITTSQESTPSLYQKSDSISY